MPDESAHLALTLESIKRQFAAKLDDEARRLLGTIATLEHLLGVPPSALVDLIPGISVSPTAATSQPSVVTGQPIQRRSLQQIRPDEYLGAEPLDAAKQYMQSVGHAVHFDEIAEAVQRGGAAIKGANWRDKLEISLVRSAYGVVKVQEKTYGLRSFYDDEQLNRLRSARRPRDAKKKTAKKKAKASPARLAKPRKTAPEPAVTEG